MAAAAPRQKLLGAVAGCEAVTTDKDGRARECGLPVTGRRFYWRLCEGHRTRQLGGCLDSKHSAHLRALASLS